MFLAFIFFCLVLFTRSDQPPEGRPPEKKVRNTIYYVCGGVMIGCLAWAAWAVAAGRPVFYPEIIAIEAFAVSWLAKGKADETLKKAAGFASKTGAELLEPPGTPTVPDPSTPPE